MPPLSFSLSCLSKGARLGRIHVRRTEDGTYIHTANVESFNLLWGNIGVGLTINGAPIHGSDSLRGPTVFTRAGREWRSVIIVSFFELHNTHALSVYRRRRQRNPCPTLKQTLRRPHLTRSPHHRRPGQHPLASLLCSSSCCARPGPLP